MPIPFLFYVLENGPPPWLTTYGPSILTAALVVALVVLIRRYTQGEPNPISPEECRLNGKVVIITGGTSGIGAAAALDLAARGAQLVLLTRTPPSDPFLVQYVQDLRARSGNELVYAEQVDLSSLHSVRRFATRWIDNAPPRRLDMVVLCAGTASPPGSARVDTDEGDGGVEETWMVNYLANFHLLGILSPAIRAQPFDRDVRIIIATCSSYISSPPLRDAVPAKSWTPSIAHARSKLALMAFAKTFQKHLDAYKRPDELPPNARVVLVDPGLARTPGMRRWLTRGSLLGLAAYLATYAFPWLLLKSPESAAQSIVYAAVEPMLGRVSGGRLIKECREVDLARRDIDDETAAKKLWEESDKLIEKVEKAQAAKRAKARKREEKVNEIASLVDAIK